jgi:hypothetical protein
MEALDTVRDKMPPWLEDAEEADTEAGKKWIEFCVNGWVSELNR